ncbi:MAG: outer membrane protein assembly factor BamD [Rikenellaceae bacterium]
MKQKIYIILFGLTVIFGSSSCGPTQKVLMSGDEEAIYAEAINQYDLGKWNKASNLFEAVESIFEGTTREDSLAFYNARCKFKRQDYPTAIELMSTFRRKYTRSPFIEDAEGILTLSYYYLSPSAERDQTNTIVAISSINEFQSRYPQSEQYETFEKIKLELIEKLQEKSYLDAYTYYKIRKYKSAIIAFRNAMKEFPDSKYREDMMFYILSSSYELARNSIKIKEVDRYMKLVDFYYSFVAEFPESKYLKEVEVKAARAKLFLEMNNPGLTTTGVVEEGTRSRREAKEQIKAEQKLRREQNKEDKLLLEERKASQQN